MCTKKIFILSKKTELYKFLIIIYYKDGLSTKDKLLSQHPVLGYNISDKKGW
jgi:hypothetical protein